MKKVLLLAAVLSIVGSSVLYLTEIETPDLGAAVLARAREATGLSLSASSSRFGLRRGLTLEDVEASSSFPGGRYRVSLQAIQLRQRLSTLWSGRIELSEAVLVEPRIEVTLDLRGGEPPPSHPEERISRDEAAPAQTSGSDVRPALPLRLAVEVTEIELVGGMLVLRDQRREENRLSLSALHFRFADVGYDSGALTMVHALTGHGAFAIGTLKPEKTEIRDITGELTVDRGRFTMDPLELTTPLGRFEGNARLDFNVIPPRYRMSLASTTATIPGMGSGELQLSAEGFGTDSRNMSGEGRLDLPEGELPPSPLRSAIEAALGIGLSSRGPATISFGLREDRVRLERSRVATREATLGVAGWLELDGAIDLTVTTEEGRTVHLTGTLDAPEVN